MRPNVLPRSRASATSPGWLIGNPRTSGGVPQVTTRQGSSPASADPRRGSRRTGPPHDDHAPGSTAAAPRQPSRAPACRRHAGLSTPDLLSLSET